MTRLNHAVLRSVAFQAAMSPFLGTFFPAPLRSLCDLCVSALKGPFSFPYLVLLPRSLLTLALLATPAFSQPADLAPVVAKSLSRTADLPGEFQPFLMVSLHARVAGYVEKVLVDRGSAVKQGQLLVELSAPEMAARIAEAESRVHAAESDRIQAEAQLAAAQSTWDKLKKAAETPGVIAESYLVYAGDCEKNSPPIATAGVVPMAPQNDPAGAMGG